MKTTITISVHCFRAVYRAMGKTYNGVLIEHDGCRTRLVATDGHRMHIAKHYSETPAKLESAIRAIIPDDEVLRVVKSKPIFPKFEDIKVEIDGARFTITDLSGLTGLACKPATWQFPDYQLVIPDSFSGEPATYNPRYLLDAVESIRDFLDLGKKENVSVPLRQNGLKPGGYYVHNFLALVMPIRTDDAVPFDRNKFIDK